MAMQTNNNPSLALMSKKQDYNRVNGTKLIVSGDWVIGKEKQNEFFGKQVIMVNSSKEGAYIGGTIVGYLPSIKNSYHTKCKVVFQEDLSLVGDTSAMGRYRTGNGVLFL
jgi:hypothetical protein